MKEIDLREGKRAVRAAVHLGQGEENKGFVAESGHPRLGDLLGNGFRRAVDLDADTRFEVGEGIEGGSGDAVAFRPGAEPAEAADFDKAEFGGVGVFAHAVYGELFSVRYGQRGEIGMEE